MLNKRADKLELLRIAEAVALEKSIDKDLIINSMETGIAKAAKSRFGQDNEIQVEINRDSGDISIFRKLLIVDKPENINTEISLDAANKIQNDGLTKKVGDEILQPLPSFDFGRIAAQIAKQVIVQKVKDAERELIIDRFRHRVGELLSGSVKKVTRDHIIVDFGDNAEGILPREELVGREIFRVNDRTRAILQSIREETRGPLLNLSRSVPEMLVQLFQIEVPEISEGIIEIKSAARDPGQRAKIAVKSKDARIDPVGACVGMRGSRVQAVSNELDEERVDIVLWDDNPAQLVINAMAPAEVESLIIDEDAGTMDVAVNEENLAQAIGKGGQNVRLASELTKWTINVMTTEDAAKKQEAESSDVVAILMEALDVDDDGATVLVDEGFTSVEEVAYVPLDEMKAIDGFDEEIAEELRARAKDALLTRALASEEKLTSKEPAEDLLAMDGMTKQLAEQLCAIDVVTMEDLAEQAVDDLLVIDGLDADKAGQLIMTARAPWFEEETENQG